MISSLSSKFINTKEVYELPLRAHDTTPSLLRVQQNSTAALLQRLNALETAYFKPLFYLLLIRKYLQH